MKDFDDILKEMLDMVSDDFDKREGGIIYCALAPIAAQIAELYFYADNIMDTTIPDTSRGEDLTRVCANSGVNRYPATKAIRKGEFTDSQGKSIDIPLDSRFGAENLIYKAVKRIDIGIYELECEKAGKLGNVYFGAILPIDNISGLGTATIKDVLIAGEDEESDEELRDRFYKTVNTQPFGGNIAQYEVEILKIPGVGGVKVFPTPNGQGGKVQCVIVDPQFRPASKTLIDKVQEIIHPKELGQGIGLAPIGHDVTISTVVDYVIDISTNIALKAGYSIDGVRNNINQALNNYLLSISFKDNVVRISRIESIILDVEGVADVTNTRLNDNSSNITLENEWNNYQVPVLGNVGIVEVS